MKIELKDYHDFCEAIREGRGYALLEMFSVFKPLIPIFAKWAAFDGLLGRELRWFDFYRGKQDWS